MSEEAKTGTDAGVKKDTPAMVAKRAEAGREIDAMFEKIIQAIFAAVPAGKLRDEGMKLLRQAIVNFIAAKVG